MKALTHAAWVAAMLFFLAAAPLKGQSVSGYSYETGVDSTLWVDMSGTLSYPNRYGQMVDIGFPFYFCGHIYNGLSLEPMGGMITLGSDRNEFAYPLLEMQNGGYPLLVPFGIVNLQMVSFRYMLVGAEGQRKFVVELSVEPPSEEMLHVRSMQVQISEMDNSVTFVYGEKHNAWTGLTYVIGMTGADGTQIYVDMDNRMTGTYTIWRSNFVDWPGKGRYYRFTPCCASPHNIRCETAVDHATVRWSGFAGDSCYQLSYRPIDQSQGWNTVIVNDTFATITGLSSPTYYESRINAICPAGCTSNMVPFTFLTVCQQELDNKFRFAALRSDSVICATSSFYHLEEVTGVVDYGPDSISSRHTVHNNVNEMDPRTNNQLRTIPEGHCLSVRLGNWRWGAERESITYVLKVDTNRYDLLILRYAIVEENPQHPEDAQPKFFFRITDSTGRLLDSCYYANFVSGVGDDNWHNGTYGVVWRDWTSVGVELSSLHGQTIYLRLDNYDCAAGGHYGYAYFTLESEYKRLRSAYCGSTQTNVFYAPDGFSYRWYRADNPGVTLSTADSLVVTSGGQYVCRASYLIGNSNCGITLTASAGPRYPVAAFTPVAADSCGYSFRFVNNSVVARNPEHTQLTSEQCEQYLWRFSDGTTSTATNPIHSFESGTHTVELVAMLAGGQCRDSVTHSVTVNRLCDTVRDTFCIGGLYNFHGRTFGQPGEYTVTDGCWKYVLRLAQKHYFHEEINETLCEGEGYMLGETIYDTSGVYERHFTTPEGCDSSYLLNLSVRPLPTADYAILRSCRGEVDYYLNKRYVEADTAYYEPGSAAFVGEDGLVYRWRAFPQGRPLPYLDEAGRMHLPVSQSTTYYIQYQYADSPACPATDTLRLNPLKPVEADLEVSPEWLGYENMTLTALDRSRYAEGRKWLLDGEEQGEEGSVFYYEVPSDADSVRVGVVAYNDECLDTAERVVPVLRHMLVFPNVFTPGREDNNLFGPIGSNVTDYELWVFDRRGVLMFHSTNMEDRWDGTSNGIVCRQESYAYTCSYTTPTNDRLTVIGTVTLLR